MLAVIGVLLDGSTSPCESATACRTNGIFRENFRQSVRELTIKCRNVGAATHDLSPTNRRQTVANQGWFCVADRRGGNSDQAQQIPQLTHSGAKYRDHSPRRSAHHSSPRGSVRPGPS